MAHAGICADGCESGFLPVKYRNDEAERYSRIGWISRVTASPENITVHVDYAHQTFSAFAVFAALCETPSRLMKNRFSISRKKTLRPQSKERERRAN